MSWCFSYRCAKCSVGFSFPDWTLCRSFLNDLLNSICILLNFVYSRTHFVTGWNQSEKGVVFQTESMLLAWWYECRLFDSVLQVRDAVKATFLVFCFHPNSVKRSATCWLARNFKSISWDDSIFIHYLIARWSNSLYTYTDTHAYPLLILTYILIVNRFSIITRCIECRKTYPK